jgi:hypothetical protein
MTAHDDKRVADVIMAIAETLNHNTDKSAKIVLTREQATALAVWFARELFGEPRKFIEEMWKSGILPGCSPPDESWWPR